MFAYVADCLAYLCSSLMTVLAMQCFRWPFCVPQAVCAYSCERLSVSVLGCVCELLLDFVILLRVELFALIFVLFVLLFVACFV